MKIQKSRVINGNSGIPALTIWQDDAGIIWLTQSGQDVSYEAWIAGSEEIQANRRMAEAIHNNAEWMQR